MATPRRGEGGVTNRAIGPRERARRRDARRSERTSRGGVFVETALGSSDEDAVFAGSGTVGADADERITRESEMEDTLAAAEKTLGASFRRFRAAMERLATLDEGLRKIDDMIDRVTRPGSGFVGSVDDRGGRRGVRGGSSDAAARRRRSACAVGGRSSEARRKTPESEIRIRDRTAVSAVSDGEASRLRPSPNPSPNPSSRTTSWTTSWTSTRASSRRSTNEGPSEDPPLAPPSRDVVSVALLRFLSPPRVARRVSAATRCFVGTRPVSTPLGWTRRFVDSSTSSAKYRRPVASRVLPSRSAFVPWETAGLGFPRTTRWRVSGTDSDAWRRSRGRWTTIPRA